MAHGNRQQGDSINLDRLADVFRARIGEIVYGVWRLQGFRDGNDFVCPNPLRADRSSGSFRIGLQGKYQGMVTDFAGEAVPGSGKQSVSALSFHIALMHGDNKGAAIAWGKDWAGLTGKAPDSLRRSHEALSKFDDRAQENAEDIKKKRTRAHRIYIDKTAPWMGSPAEDYYRGRGIDLTRLPFMAGAPKFKERCFCGELGKPGTDDGAYLPAIILPYNAMDGSFWAVHRTYLERTTDGRWIKHSGLKKAKTSYAPYAGGVIPLWAGTRALKRTGEVAYGQSMGKAEGPIRVHLTEGPEDGWSVALAYPHERVNVAGSVSNMGGLAYPEKVTEVVIWKQADPPGSPADRAFRQAVLNLKNQGKKVMVADVTTVMPGVKDANDVLKGAM
ncbi:MAG: toprim domain-containing protein [Rhodospirillaceae bacterium]|nr:toprim domain-containing protein [Rhodospirillales bacterium]